MRSPNMLNAGRDRKSQKLRPGGTARRVGVCQPWLDVHADAVVRVVCAWTRASN